MQKRVPRYETEFVQLEDWLTVEDASKLLEITPTRLRQLIEDRRFRQIALVGSRPQLLLPRTEVEAMRKAQQKRA